MDIGALSDENFNVVEWVNATLKNSDNQQNKEVVVSSLVAKLQLYVQQVNSALEDTSQQVLGGMPRIMKDAQSLQNEALLLKSKMAEVQNDIFQVHKETGNCMANLERLDCLKNKLQVAKEGLQESDGWGRLITELEDLFEQNDIQNACEKLKSLQKSLVAQAGLPGQSERESQLEGFKNRLEALASPAVVQCFTNSDSIQSKKYVDIFTNMGRLSQLIQYYRTVQKRLLQQHWTETNELSRNTNTTQFLREFYDHLFETYQKQVKWCNTVFGVQGAQEPVWVIIELLPSLQPSRETVINSLLKNNDDKLSILEGVSNANIHFGRLLAANFKDADVSVDVLKKISGAIYDYFTTFIGQTATFEQQWLMTRLNELILIHSNAIESVRALGNANNKIFQWSNDTLRRCQAITQNCGLAAIVVVLSDFFKTFLEKYRKAQQQLHASQSTEQDWNLLQTCISLLQYIGDFRINLSQFEETLSNTILNKDKEITNQNENVLELCSTYQINGKREWNDFKKLVDNAQVLSSYQQRGGIFSNIFDQIKPICEYIHDTTLASIFAPIENQLKTFELDQDALDVSGSDLPDYSFAPQEFITVIGQYLLTLPQHLEPLLLTPNQQLKLALELCDDRYARNSGNTEEPNEPSADILLSLLAEECCALYAERISQVCEISTFGAKQIACDIEYLGSVLEELGLSLSPHLQQLITLLRAPNENYLTVSAGCDPRLVTAIRQMRNIVSKE